jgi:hypothetical protein
MRPPPSAEAYGSALPPSTRLQPRDCGDTYQLQAFDDFLKSANALAGASSADM